MRASRYAIVGMNMLLCTRRLIQQVDAVSLCICTVLCNKCCAIINTFLQAEEEAVAVVRCRPLEGVHASDPEEGAVEPAAVDGGFAAEREVDEVDDGLQGATDTQHDEL